MPTATVRGLNIFYRVIGDDGPWIALITGGRRGHDEFVPLAEMLAERGYRVLLHDRRNTGGSEVKLGADEVEEITWADDLYELLGQLGATPACIGGSSSGARTAMLFGIRHPDATRALLLLRVTGGPFAAGRLPENYYGRFIRAAEEGGMEAICETDVWSERIAANPAVRDYLMSIDPKDFIAMQTKLMDLFVAGKDLPVMGVPQDDLDGIKAPTIVIPGNDNTHSSESGRIAHKLINGAELYDLGLEDIDVPLIGFDEWAPYYDEIAGALDDFIKRKAG
jgi:pimeloyl-ACP methyl ester carboxylesterase